MKPQLNFGLGEIVMCWEIFLGVGWTLLPSGLHVLDIVKVGLPQKVGRDQLFWDYSKPGLALNIGEESGRALPPQGGGGHCSMPQMGRNTILELLLLPCMTFGHILVLHI